MLEDELELYLHVEGEKPRLINGKPGETLREVLLRSDAIGLDREDVKVFVGECEEALHEPQEVENGTDVQAPVNIDLTLEVLELRHHRHVHRHRCRHVAVIVHFGGDTKHHRFSPATTIGVVTRWARKKFKLEGAAGDEYVLQICDTTKQPRSDEHLSDLVKEPDCAVCFNLIKEITPQG